MAVKAVNDTAGPDRLVPTLLVYRAYPRMSNLDPPAPSVMDRATAIQKAMAEIVKLRARKSVNNALHHRNGPDTTSVHDLPLNLQVLVWRESGNWTRPHHLLAIEGETCHVQLTSRPTSFRTTSIKPYLQTPETTRDDKVEEHCKPAEQTPPTVKRGRGRPRKHPVSVSVTDTSIADVSIFI